MLNLILFMMLGLGQLSGPGGALPQIVHPEFKNTVPAPPGKKGEVTVSFAVLKGFAINRNPPMSLKLTSVPGVSLAKSQFSTPTKDPKSKDEYYVDMPTIKVGMTAAKAGNYEVPGKLTYFFCNKADGFCSRQVLDVRIPVEVR